MACNVIAHRGSNKVCPQNTLPAFSQAIREKTNGFETDVHLTKDGVPVICHNYTIDATSDGVGELSSYTLAELKKFDFGGYFSADFKNTPIPTLDEFLSLVAPSTADIINIELKYEKNSMGELVRKTLECVKKHGLLDRVIVSSFSPNILKSVKETDSRCKTAFLYPTLSPSTCRPVMNPFFIAKRIGADILHPASVVVTKPLVKIAHKLGMKVNVWTVNDEKTVKFLLSCKVDGIITDCPAKVRKIIDKEERANG